MIELLLSYIICFILLSAILFLLRLKYSENKSWHIVDNIYEEYHGFRFGFQNERNSQEIDIDRLQVIEDTVVKKNESIYCFSKIAGEYTKRLPLHTLAHSDGGRCLTTIYLSFHMKEKQLFLDIQVSDEEHFLPDSQLSLLFTNGTQWNLSYSHNGHQKSEQSYPLTNAELIYFAENTLDKWRIKKHNRFIVGALNFDTGKYICKPEIQETIRIMAKKILECMKS